MQITYLGHAGFCIETARTIIIMDPWLSPWGAFDAAWFQYPQNHHLSHDVQNILKQKDKNKYIYISHEHKDHFDLSFLESLPERDFIILLADFVHPAVKNELNKANYQCKGIISLKDNERFYFKDGFLALFLLDMELDCDSAILVKTETGTFLNLNDCKIHERLGNIFQEYHPIDVFTEQFSGAVWHPTCFNMSQEKYEIICKRKINTKFEHIAQAIETLKPAMYLPSAGPPCFLDPILFPINFEKINSYPRAPQLIEFLNQYFQDKNVSTQWTEIMPGDTLDVPQLKFSYLSPLRVKDNEFQSYVKNYAAQYDDFFKQRHIENAKINPEEVFIALGEELRKKLDEMQFLRKNIPTSLYFALNDFRNEMYCVDFLKNSITSVSRIEHPHYLLITTPAWQVNKVLQKEINWPDFALTFRVKITREPDIYNTLMHGFLTLEVESLKRFSQIFTDILSKKERMIIEYKGRKYSVLRYCPHQGGDLLEGRIEDCFLICPRHQWKFDLENHGDCRYNHASIEAIDLGKIKE